MDLEKVKPQIIPFLTNQKRRVAAEKVFDGAEVDKWIRRLIARERDHRFVDLIIANQRMPTATGLEVLARLRHADWSTPYILITALGDTVTHVEAERLGASCVIDKPYALDDLRAAALRFAMALRQYV